MMDIIRQIKKLATEMLKGTSTNDDRHEMLRDQIDLCDEAINHFTDDMK